MNKAKAKARVTWVPVTLLSLLVVVLSIALVLVISSHNDPVEDAAVDTGTTNEIPVVKNPDSIAVPGYEVLELQANTKQQTLRLPNPPQNVCYFKISLYLDDSVLLWQSELIEPGATSEPIVLLHVLDKGTYSNAILKYECFKMDGKTPLNGAETKLALWVK